MSEDSFFWGLAQKRVKWQVDTITKRRRPLQGHYLAEEQGYKDPLPQTQIQLEKQLEEVASWWEGLQGWWFSGAPSISLQTIYTRPHTNIDIGVMRIPQLLEQMAERAEKARYYPFERKASWKLIPGSNTKQELLEAIDIHQLIYDARQNRNPQLLQVEEGRINIGNEPIQHIHIHMHDQRGNDYISLEDGLSIPRGAMIVTPYHVQSGKTIPFIRPDYMRKVKEVLIAKGNKNQKHQEDLAKIQQMK